MAAVQKRKKKKKRIRLKRRRRCNCEDPFAMDDCPKHGLRQLGDSGDSCCSGSVVAVGRPGSNKKNYQKQTPVKEVTANHKLSAISEHSDDQWASGTATGLPTSCPTR